MFKLTLLAALVAICVAQSTSFSGSRTADMDFLHKQKKIFDLLLYVRQADLSDAEWYDIGRNYNVETNMDMYKDKNVVQKFFWWYKQGMFLVRDAIFTPFNTEHMYEMRMLFELFYNAKDFQTFYKTACWARLHMNSDMFTTAFSVAVFYRSDCKYMRLPAIYEIYPNYFFDSSVIQEAQYLKMSQGNQCPGVAYNGRHRLWLSDRPIWKEGRHLHIGRFEHTRQRDRRECRLLQHQILRHVRRTCTRHPWLQLRLFFRYKKFQPQYSQSELQVPGVKFESVNIDKLNTYFDTCDTLISNAVSVDSFKSGMYLRLKARRACLNYQPFTYKININSDKEMKGMLRIFLGPAFDEVQQDMIYLQKYHYYFVEMDRFAVNLHSGSNSIERHSSESLNTAPGMMSSDIYYDKLNKAISGSEPFTYSERMFGFPERFTLPRGKPEGLRYKMFFFLSSLEENSMNSYEMPLYGKMMFDNMPFGFPLDRPMFAWNYTIPNMFFKDVYIYNRPYEKERMNY